MLALHQYHHPSQHNSSPNPREGTPRQTREVQYQVNHTIHHATHCIDVSICHKVLLRSASPTSRPHGCTITTPYTKPLSDCKATNSGQILGDLDHLRHTEHTSVTTDQHRRLHLLPESPSCLAKRQIGKLANRPNCGTLALTLGWSRRIPRPDRNAWHLHHHYISTAEIQISQDGKPHTPPRTQQTRQLTRDLSYNGGPSQEALDRRRSLLLGHDPQERTTNRVYKGCHGVY